MDLCAIHDDLVVILVGFVRAIEYAETQFDPEAPVGTGVDSGKGFQGVAVWAASGVRTHHQNEERDMKTLCTGLAFGLAAALTASSASAAITFFNSRPAFEAALGTFITDGYNSPPYGAGFQIYSDAVMSAFLGETDYQTTGFSNLNIKDANGRYCAGCNGSFRLSFTTTSVGSANGVYGAGLDITVNSTSLPYHAFITFGDNTTQDVLLPTTPGFWGVTADQEIKSIHFGLANGGTTTNGSFQIDNLTIGSALVPAPGALALLGAAGLMARRRRRA